MFRGLMVVPLNRRAARFEFGHALGNRTLTEAAVAAAAAAAAVAARTRVTRPPTPMPPRPATPHVPLQPGPGPGPGPGPASPAPSSNSSVAASSCGSSITRAEDAFVVAASILAVPAPAPVPGPACIKRECSLCCDQVEDLTDGSPEDEEAWTEAVEDFPGLWTVAVRGFPPASFLSECASRHALSHCRGCLARHLRTQIESLGRDAAGRLTCPEPDCGHVYTHDQVRAILLMTAAAAAAANANANVAIEEENGTGAANAGAGAGAGAGTDSDDAEALFARYDRFCLLKHLSSVEGFMWCLRPGCENGQIHLPPAPLPLWRRARDETRDREREREASQRVSCEACGFEMCLRHQMAWHDNLTCAGYDRLSSPPPPSSSSSSPSSSGSPSSSSSSALSESALSKAWIDANTKRCPGKRCGIPVEKNEGCFHMTCRSCAFQFCWECLAPWSDVYDASTNTWTPQGHRDGCAFKVDNSPTPTSVTGNTIEEALARRRARRG